MNKARADQWEKLLNLLDEADAVQQRLLNDEHPDACYEFHTSLNQIRDDLECFAAQEEQESEQ